MGLAVRQSAARSSRAACSGVMDPCSEEPVCITESVGPSCGPGRPVRAGAAVGPRLRQAQGTAPQLLERSSPPCVVDAAPLLSISPPPTPPPTPFGTSAASSVAPAPCSRSRADRTCRADRRAGAHHGRERNGEGAGRGGDPRGQRAPAGRLPSGQLQCGLCEPVRERAVRPRAGKLHRRRPPADRPLRASLRRDPAARRSDGDAAGPAGEAPAGDRDERPAPRRQQRSRPARRPDRRHHQPGAWPGGEGGTASGGPLLPTQRLSHRRPRCVAAGTTSPCSPGTSSRSSTVERARASAGGKVRSSGCRKAAGRATCESSRARCSEPSSFAAPTPTSTPSPSRSLRRGTADPLRPRGRRSAAPSPWRSRS
jgi:hypothetical protein